MSTSPLVNTRSALVFAGITIFGTLMMVSPSENGGMLDRLTNRTVQQSGPAPAAVAVTATQTRPQAVEPLDPDAGWGGTGDPVFGDYASAEMPGSDTLPEDSAPEDSAPAAVASPQQARRTSPLPQTTGGPVKADSLGELVPRDGSGAAPQAEAVVTSRSINIELE